jgi:hypothetical protein
MPIFCWNVNFAFREKLVPITRRNSTSIEPTAEAIVLKWVEWSPENGPVESRKLVPTYSLEVSQSRAGQMMSILKLPHGYPWCSPPLLLIPFVCGR